MSKNQNSNDIRDADYEKITGSIPYILASLAGGIDGFQLFSITLQRIGDNDFRVILRGAEGTGTGDSLRLVCFTNDRTPGECILRAEQGFRDSTGRWHIDKFANGDGEDGSAKAGVKAREFVKDFQF